jgi:hypothetical protein
MNLEILWRVVSLCLPLILQPLNNGTGTGKERVERTVIRERLQKKRPWSILRFLYKSPFISDVISCFLSSYYSVLEESSCTFILAVLLKLWPNVCFFFFDITMVWYVSTPKQPVCALRGFSPSAALAMSVSGRVRGPFRVVPGVHRTCSKVWQVIGLL